MSLHVESSGCGPDLVLLHGWGMHGGVWEPVAKALSESFRLHIVDLPGLGRSPSIASCTLESLADAVARVLPSDATVCGWSLGGQVAMRWALDRPGQVRKLILVGSTPRFVSGGDWNSGVEAEVFRLFADQVREDYRGTLGRFLALQALGGDASKETIRLLREHFFERGEPQPGVLQSGLEILMNTDLRSETGGLTMPTLVLHGSNDRLAPAAAGVWLAQHLPAAELAICEGASHAPFLSHSTWFVRVIKEFHGG